MDDECAVHLAGYCFGGSLALKIAAQLTDARVSVLSTTLIDTSAPVPEHAQAMETHTLLGLCVYDLSAGAISGSSFANELSLLSPGCGRTRCAQELVAHQVCTDETAGEKLLEDALAQLAIASTMQSHLSMPSSLQTPITLVRACDDWPYAYLYNPHQRMDMGWGFLYDDPAAVRVLSTPGDHCTVLTEQYASALAELLAVIFTGNVRDTESVSLCP